MAEAGSQTPKELIEGIRILVRLSRVAQWECERSGLTLPQYRALLTVSQGTRRASEIADFAAVSRPAVTALVNGLEELGLLRREAVPGDGRGVHLVATRKGRRAVERAERHMADRFLKIVGGSDELKALLNGLPGLEEALDEDVARDVFGKEKKPSAASAPPRRRSARSERARAKAN